MGVAGCGQGCHPGDTGVRLERRSDQGNRKQGDEFQRPVGDECGGCCDPGGSRDVGEGKEPGRITGQCSDHPLTLKTVERERVWLAGGDALDGTIWP